MRTRTTSSPSQTSKRTSPTYGSRRRGRSAPWRRSSAPSAAAKAGDWEVPADPPGRGFSNRARRDGSLRIWSRVQAETRRVSRQHGQSTVEGGRPQTGQSQVRSEAERRAAASNAKKANDFIQVWGRRSSCKTVETCGSDRYKSRLSGPRPGI